MLFKSFSGNSNKNIPSIAVYRSKKNNADNYPNEIQTIYNLDYFAYMRKTYGMQLDGYILDGKSSDLTSGFPKGFNAIDKMSSAINMFLGLGQIPEKADIGYLSELLKNFNFKLFEFERTLENISKDGEKQFKNTVDTLRLKKPDLTIINSDTGIKKVNIINKWKYGESYTDVDVCAPYSAPHHRGYIFDRDIDLRESTSDNNGVYLSSCLNRFDDELIMNAFGHGGDPAIQICGNPWFLRDDEQSALARIFNLYKRHSDILKNVEKLPLSYGKNAVSRGDGKRRFILLTNPSWQTKTLDIKINSALGLKRSDRFYVIRRFPTENVLGIYGWGDKVSVSVLPFRVALFEVTVSNTLEIYFGGSEYTVLHENAKGEPDKIKIVASDGKLLKYKNGKSDLYYSLPVFDNTEKAPVFLGAAADIRIPQNDRQLYEAAMFSVSNDSLERQSVFRSGDSGIKSVISCRNAFFVQRSYEAKGCDQSAMFDDSNETYFDGRSLTYPGGLRVKGGCLRIDLNVSLYINDIEITYFDPDTESAYCKKQVFGQIGEYSTDLLNWKKTVLLSVAEKCGHTHYITEENTQKIIPVSGKLKKALYSVNGSVRYFELPEPMMYIYSVKVLIKGVPIRLPEIKGNNLMAPYSAAKTKMCKTLDITVPEKAEDKQIVCAIDGKHGVEGVYCVAECDGKLYGFSDRASSYPSNVWNKKVIENDSGYTYFLRPEKQTFGKKMRIYFLFNNEAQKINTAVYVCDADIERKGVILNVC